MMSIQPLSGLIAYPAEPDIVGKTIREALEQSRGLARLEGLSSWEDNDIAGRMIINPILEAIDNGNILVADISTLNFNVAYEIGYAIGRGRRVYPINHKALRQYARHINEVGMLDLIGYKPYSNARELINILMSIDDLAPIDISQRRIDPNAPLFLLSPSYKSDSHIRLVSRIIKTGFQFREYDPEEGGRLSAGEAIKNVKMSFGVIIPILPSNYEGAMVHNFRAAFVAGLAIGMGKRALLLQEASSDKDQDPVALDIRDLVVTYRDPGSLTAHLQRFCEDIATRQAAYRDQREDSPKRSTTLTDLNLGEPVAEQEQFTLSRYFIETPEFHRALKGSVRVVAGRKGTGKTAILVHLDNKLKQHGQNVVVRLEPYSDQLIKFKEMTLKFLTEGTQEHLLTSFWEYLLLLEVTQKLLATRQDENNHHLTELRRKLKDEYYSDEYLRSLRDDEDTGSFAEKMLDLGQRIFDDITPMVADQSGESQILSGSQITQLLYLHDIARLRELLLEYLREKESLWLLFDNIDKGWNAGGVTKEDTRLIRTLITAMAKIEHSLRRRSIVCHGVIFLRNDILELVMRHIPDHGKLASVSLDWSDPVLLQKFIKRRMIVSGMPVRPETNFHHAWQQICVSHVDGIDSWQYLVDRSLMRPRFLLKLINACKNVAMRHDRARIAEEDVKAGAAEYCNMLAENLGQEIADVIAESSQLTLPASIENQQDLVLALEQAASIMPYSDFCAHMANEFDDPALVDEVLNQYVWYGIVGVSDAALGKKPVYIYDVYYNTSRMQRLLRRVKTGAMLLEINPAFQSLLRQ